MVRAMHDDDSTPVPGVSINGRVMLTEGGPVPVPEATTDAEGEARIEFDVPADPALGAILVIQAQSDIGDYELSKPIC